MKCYIYRDLQFYNFFRVGADHGQEETNNALEDGVNPDLINNHQKHHGPDETTKCKM